MQELIAQLQVATEGERGLDLAIQTATSGKPWYWMDSFQSVITWDQYGKGAPGNPVATLERFTSSIDDALMLVPEGWQWQSSNRAPKPHAGRAYIHNGELIYAGMSAAKNPKYRHEEATAATPAIALCIAALRARSALMGRQE